MPFSPGRAVDVVYTKYDGSPHWEHAAIYLGEDEYGHWAGVPKGTRMVRPGRVAHTGVTCVMCFPHEQWWVISANFCIGPPHQSYRFYVDMTTIPTWEDEGGALRVRMVDLDLDVVLPQHGAAYLDDEDEFAAHQLAYGYPSDVIAAAQASAQSVLNAVTDPRDEPYATVCDLWMDRFFQLLSAQR